MQDYVTKLAQLFGPYVPSLLGAIAILVIGWFVALIISSLVRRAVKRTGIGPRLTRLVHGDATVKGADPERWIGKGVFYLILLFVLAAFFQALGLTIASNPLGQFLTQVFGYATHILGALVLVLVAWIVATAVRFGVVRVLTSGFANQRLNALFATTMEAGGVSLSQTIGEVVYWLIFLLFLPAVLGALGLEGILVPVQAMLNKLLIAVPNIFAAALVLTIAWLLARILRKLISSVLETAGFNTILAKLGLGSLGAEASQKPSSIVGYLVMIALMLFASIEASQLLGFQTLSNIISQLTVFFGQVLLGVVVFAIGLYVANLAASLVRAASPTHANILANAARVAILTLAAAMALRQMGIASEIINLAFGFLIGAIAVAVALAFGLGGRETAGQIVAEWRRKAMGD